MSDKPTLRVHNLHDVKVVYDRGVDTFFNCVETVIVDGIYVIFRENGEIHTYPTTSVSSLVVYPNGPK